MLTTAMLTCVKITKTYANTQVPAVNGVSLTVEKGEFVSLVGRSGSGKSTLLHILSSLVLPSSGELWFEGRDICKESAAQRNILRRHAFAVVFQQHHLLPYLTALENVLLPFAHRLWPVNSTDTAQARAMLERVGLAGKEHARQGELSGGEQQRVAIARALARGTQILFVDEPTGSLDFATGQSIMDLLHSLNGDGRTIIMVTHNPEYARQSHRTLTLEDGVLLHA